MRIEKWIEKNTRSLSGKTVAISGSTGGLGRELCRHIACLGGSLVLVDRNYKKSLALAEELRGEFSGLSIKQVTADMSDMNSVRSCADELSAMEIDYLILNAGAYSIPRCVVDTGYYFSHSCNFCFIVLK